MAHDCICKGVALLFSETGNSSPRPRVSLPEALRMHKQQRMTRHIGNGQTNQTEAYSYMTATLAISFGPRPVTLRPALAVGEFTRSPFFCSSSDTFKLW